MPFDELSEVKHGMKSSNAGGGVGGGGPVPVRRHDLRRHYDHRADHRAARHAAAGGRAAVLPSRHQEPSRRRSRHDTARYRAAGRLLDAVVAQGRPLALKPRSLRLSVSEVMRPAARAVPHDMPGRRAAAPAGSAGQRGHAGGARGAAGRHPDPLRHHSAVAARGRGRRSRLRRIAINRHGALSSLPVSALGCSDRMDRNG